MGHSIPRNVKKSLAHLEVSSELIKRLRPICALRLLLLCHSYHRVMAVWSGRQHRHSQMASLPQARQTSRNPSLAPQLSSTRCRLIQHPYQVAFLQRAKCMQLLSKDKEIKLPALLKRQFELYKKKVTQNMWKSKKALGFKETYASTLRKCIRERN